VLDSKSCNPVPFSSPVSLVGFSDSPATTSTATASGGSRLIRFAEPSEDSGCPSPDSSSSSSNGVVAAPPVPAEEGGAPAIGPQLKLLPMNDQLRELQTIIRDNIKYSMQCKTSFSSIHLVIKNHWFAGTILKKV
uniref:Uncharacterized protein n=1 Tax=Catharus ustulatus TaxID=91951 RepID=A0A8C3V7P3_CATUS